MAIVKSYRSDDSDYTRYSCAKQGIATLHHRTAEGVKNQQKAREKWRSDNKKAIAADGAIRDGPAYNIKECQNCGAFIPAAAQVCSTCDVPATALGARSVSNNSHPANSTSVGAISASAQCAVDLLSNALLAMDTNRMYVVKEIHAKSGTGNHTKYHIEWCGFPVKADWTWQMEDKLKDKHGKWTCPRAMAEFQQKQRKK